MTEKNIRTEHSSDLQITLSRCENSFTSSQVWQKVEAWSRRTDFFVVVTSERNVPWGVEYAPTVSRKTREMDKILPRYADDCREQYRLAF